MAQAVLQRPVSEQSDDQEFTSITNSRRQNAVNNASAGDFICVLKLMVSFLSSSKLFLAWDLLLFKFHLNQRTEYNKVVLYCSSK